MSKPDDMPLPQQGGAFRRYADGRLVPDTSEPAPAEPSDTAPAGVDPVPPDDGGEPKIRKGTR